MIKIIITIILIWLNGFAIGYGVGSEELKENKYD